MKAAGNGRACRRRGAAGRGNEHGAEPLATASGGGTPRAQRGGGRRQEKRGVCSGRAGGGPEGGTTGGRPKAGPEPRHGCRAPSGAGGYGLASFAGATDGGGALSQVGCKRHDFRGHPTASYRVSESRVRNDVWIECVTRSSKRRSELEEEKRPRSRWRLGASVLRRKDPRSRPVVCYILASWLIRRMTRSSNFPTKV